MEIIFQYSMNIKGFPLMECKNQNQTPICVPQPAQSLMRILQKLVYLHDIRNLFPQYMSQN